MRRALIALVAASCLACGDTPPPKTASPSLVSEAPVPPGAVRVSASEGAEAVEVVYRAGLVPDTVAAWYRRWFLEHRWRITGDTRLADGTLVLHADSAAQPLWLMIRPDPAGANFSVMSAEPGAAPR